jgi:hypothetical protein
MLDSSKWLEFLKSLLYVTLWCAAMIAIGLVYIRRTKERWPNVSREEEEGGWIALAVFFYLLCVVCAFLFTFFGDWVKWIPAPGPINAHP